MSLFTKIAAFLGTVIALSASAGSIYGWFDEAKTPDSLIK